VNVENGELIRGMATNQFHNEIIDGLHDFRLLCSLFLLFVGVASSRVLEETKFVLKVADLPLVLAILEGEVMQSLTRTAQYLEVQAGDQSLRRDCFPPVLVLHVLKLVPDVFGFDPCCLHPRVLRTQ